MKKMILEKKANLPVCTNFLATFLINFKRNESAFTKLLGLLEKRLNQKNKSQEMKSVNNTWNFASNKKILN